jgi:hypothetical protein
MSIIFQLCIAIHLLGALILPPSQMLPKARSDVQTTADTQGCMARYDDDRLDRLVQKRHPNGTSYDLDYTTTKSQDTHFLAGETEMLSLKWWVSFTLVVMNQIWVTKPCSSPRSSQMTPATGVVPRSFR